MVLCGAVPVYVNPDVNQKLGISLGMEVDKVRQAIEDNPDAVAVFVNNPTYYGICSDIKTIVELAHARGMKALADEAHGPTCTLEKIFRCLPWRPERIWRRFPCTNPAEA